MIRMTFAMLSQGWPLPSGKRRRRRRWEWY